MTYKCKHFAIHELVPKHIFESRGEKAWELLDKNALITLDRLRGKYGPMTVNNYFWGGNRNWSGLRTPESSYYSPTSQHTLGKAFDCLFKDTTVNAVRQDILMNPNNVTFNLINAVELDVPWLHFDVRNCDRIKQFSA